MKFANSSNFNNFIHKISVFLFLVFFLYCPNLLAAQDAVVLSERAVIYSDLEMTSPIGFVQKGKKVRVGEIPRNNAQLYPIVVAGRIGYIQVIDVSTEKERVDAQFLTAERFKKNIRKNPESKFAVSYLTFSSIINATKVNGEVQNGDLLSWQGLSTKGEALVLRNTDVQVIVNYLTTTSGNEGYRIVEIGAGGAYRFLSTERFLAKLEAQVLGIPHASYNIGSDFRINSYGFSLGGGPSFTYFLKSGTGIELYGHFYRTQLLGFDLPEPYENTAVSFTGARVGLGFNLTF
jgi:hypothetical protein